MQMRFVVAPISRPPHPKGKGRLRDGPFNPALVLTQRPDEIDLIVMLTADELFPGGVGAIDQVNGGKQRLLGQRLMNRFDSGDVLGRRCGSFHVRDEMGRVVLTGLREMHLISAPALPTLLTIARGHIIGRGDHHG